MQDNNTNNEYIQSLLADLQTLVTKGQATRLDTIDFYTKAEYLADCVSADPAGAWHTPALNSLVSLAIADPASDTKPGDLAAENNDGFSSAERRHHMREAAMQTVTDMLYQMPQRAPAIDALGSIILNAASSEISTQALKQLILYTEPSDARVAETMPLLSRISRESNDPSIRSQTREFMLEKAQNETPQFLVQAIDDLILGANDKDDTALTDAFRSMMLIANNVQVPMTAAQVSAMKTAFEKAADDPRCAKFSTFVTFGLSGTAVRQQKMGR